MKISVKVDVARQDMLCRNMYDQAKAGLMDHLRSERAQRGLYWENAVTLMVVHLTTGALESFINGLLHFVHAWPNSVPFQVTDEDLARMIDGRTGARRKWQWLGEKGCGGTWFSKNAEPFASYSTLVDLRNDLADHDKSPILLESEGWTNKRRQHLTEVDLRIGKAAGAIVTVTEMVASLRQAILAGDGNAPITQDGWRVIWEWAHVKEPEILARAGRPTNPIGAL